MTINEILDAIEDMLEKSWGLPISGGKSVVDTNKISDLINEIRLNMPSEIKHAKMIVNDRTQIIEEARKEAETIIANAELRAKKILNEQDIVKAAQEKANEILTDAHSQSREIRNSASEFVDDMLKHTEEVFSSGLTQTRETRQKFRKMSMKRK
ncbi:MAG TPA: ATPase [Firmicutes bacterium]|nr:ATPase [Bacillota bacterium]